MARPKKSDSPNLSESHELTAGLIERLTCPAGKMQAFLRDAKAPGLRVRVTAAGAKSYVFEAKLNRNTIRRTIGDVRAWTIEAAREEANKLRVTVDAGTDPRQVERDRQAATEAKVVADKKKALTVGEAWAAYVEERRSHWGDLHYRDVVAKASPGGVPFKRDKSNARITQEGLLFPFMALPLNGLTAPVIEAWAAKEAKTRPTSARLAWCHLRAFLGWCDEQTAYEGLLPSKNPAKTKKTREAFGKKGVKSDVLQREQLSTWFAAVRRMRLPISSAYLQTLLLIGARPGEALSIRWEDIDFRWKSLTIHDKVEDERTIPLTPYVAHLVSQLPRRNQWVFSSLRTESGHITEQNLPHSVACKAVGIDGLTLHGLRRSFKSVTEWLNLPAGVVAQIMGHKPSATAEKHYTVRPLDLLRVHHERIEAWILEQAGIVFDAKVEPAALRVVNS